MLPAIVSGIVIGDEPVSYRAFSHDLMAAILVFPQQ